MILRCWTGVVQPGKSEAYIDHLKKDTFQQLSGIPGFIRASILKRPVEDGTEFQIITDWESMDAIRQFAGAHTETAVVPPVARALMVRFDAAVKHYELVN